MAKKLLFEDAARQKMLKGVQTIAKAVKSTLGPAGRNVVIEKKFGSPVITKDGVTVAREVDLEDPYENMGAQILREAANKTNSIVGDGTSSTAVLTEAILTEGLKKVAAGFNPVDIQRGINKTAESVAVELCEFAQRLTSADDIKQVATVSANWDSSIGSIIAEAMTKVGKDGTITVEESQGIETSLVVTEGMQIDKGYISPYFVTDSDSMEVVMNDPYVLINEGKISSISNLMPVLEKVLRTGKPLVIIAEDVDGEALAMLVTNKLRGTLSSVAIKSPAFGDRRKAIMQDLAVMLGAKYISSDLGVKLENVNLEDLGKAKRITVSKDETVIVEGAGSQEAIELRKAQIRKQIEDTTSEYDREKLQERLAKLSGGIAIIKVGAHTETSMREKKDRVDDALNAARAAVEVGIVAGGGTALIQAQKHVRCIVEQTPDFFRSEDERVGGEILLKALEAPLRQLVENDGGDASMVIGEVRKSDPRVGYNVRTGAYENLLESGVIDPVKVTYTAVVNAASAAGIMLTAECMISEIKDKQQTGLPQPMNQMPF